MNAEITKMVPQVSLEEIVSMKEADPDNVILVASMDGVWLVSNDWLTDIAFAPYPAVGRILWYVLQDTVGLDFDPENPEPLGDPLQHWLASLDFSSYTDSTVCATTGGR